MWTGGMFFESCASNSYTAQESIFDIFENPFYSRGYDLHGVYVCSPTVAQTFINSNSPATGAHKIQ